MPVRAVSKLSFHWQPLSQGPLNTYFKFETQLLDASTPSLNSNNSIQPTPPKTYLMLHPHPDQSAPRPFHKPRKGHPDTKPSLWSLEARRGFRRRRWLAAFATRLAASSLSGSGAEPLRPWPRKNSIRVFGFLGPLGFRIFWAFRAFRVFRPFVFRV